ncbi:hypothetical protein DPMN_070048 [Dreissena polymorpha]|uniref:Uncharacterized protein n=1 Tax=Dreissena polymorpha TaxID=45954 RepID=A0A9D3Z5A8_DREPO|nr:hypothetical protein DPMN_070048 [Dreissena polymorpha]
MDTEGQGRGSVLAPSKESLHENTSMSIIPSLPKLCSNNNVYFEGACFPQALSIPRRIAIVCIKRALCLWGKYEAQLALKPD